MLSQVCLAAVKIVGDVEAALGGTNVTHSAHSWPLPGRILHGIDRRRRHIGSVYGELNLRARLVCQ